MNSSAPIVTGAELRTQVFLGDEKSDPDRVDPVTNRDDGVVKPDGGLWTSSARDGEPCAWIQWCRREGYGIGPNTRAWWLEPDPDARVVQIDSVDDMEWLLERYERPGQSVGEMFAPFDYEAMAESVDGVRITEQGEAETRFAQPGLYGWDTESTVWFDWQFRDVTDGGPVGRD